eukprot:TRINITY_DN42184_c0_g1_i1.p1 TRINITY_DN42184_c0_g1~~TRINITY_DN42184_c0_g1_i1.p1  ORF type:complete len:311 (-),score=42.48 TRINITY_DN42184_c0_g1_i1:113-1045(-)
MSAQRRLDVVRSQLPESYRFTLNGNGLLTEEQRRSYETNGFFVVKGLLSAEEITRYTQRFQEVATSGVGGTMIVMRDVDLKNKKAAGEHNITKLQNWEDDPVLFEYCKTPKVLDYVESIIGPDIKSVHTMLINKPPDLGRGTSRHPPHQDLWYFPFRPADKVVAAWAALQHIDEQNGCLFVKPGSHTEPLYVHEYPQDGTVNKAYHGIQGMSSEKDAAGMTNLVMEPGDVVFFHSLLIHGSLRNNSDRFRKAICCHFASSSCHWHIDPKQQAIADEVSEMAKKRAGVAVDFMDVWRYKSRLVRGCERTLK